MRKNIRSFSLIMNIFAIIITATLLIGSTFAWFTDSATSSGNVIKSGNLDVEMRWADGKEHPINADWKDASKGAIFNYENWEPGYTEVRHIKIENAGTLAFKYKVSIAVNGEVSNLADIIDVYYVDPATQVTDRNALSDADNIGTLREVLAVMPETANGTLIAGEDYTITLALKMKKDIGNEYQGLSIGTKFSVKVAATQLSSESDGFGNDYDANLDPATRFVYGGKELNGTTATSGTVELSNDFATSDFGDDSRYGYGYEYIIRNRADYTLELNGKTLVHDTINANANKNAFTYLFVANHAGTKLTINGNGNVYCNNSEGYTCAIQGKDGTLITINGGDYQVDNGIAVWAGAGAHIIINDGSFINGNATTSHELIYSSGGVIDIYGGFFYNTDGNYTLNIEDRNRSTGFINVYGGTFVNFNPLTGGQDPNNIKVAEGYTVIAEKQENGDIWYIVVPE